MRLGGVPVDSVPLDGVPGDRVAVVAEFEESAVAAVTLNEHGVDVMALVGAVALSSSIVGATRAATAALADGVLEFGTAALDDDAAGAVAGTALGVSAPWTAESKSL